MIVIFGRNKHWISRTIQLITRFKFSHVGILDGGYVIEAKGPIGVVKTPLFDFLERYDETEFRKIDGDIRRARKLIGKPFDKSGILAFILPWKKQNPEEWFCSEVLALASHAIADEFAHNVAPKHVYWISRPLDGKGEIGYAE